ncbi:hypothetical protein ABIE78_002929 [Sinorhizobium fredii]|uniref:HPr kinase n=1 Tax=Sinorhizobium fredii (strain USDA 257) TaxID=1185652 RepID=I3X5V6_SINF2|nr:hypothetical protein [Sinorhizobium fredii]AFL51262.1 hypothetical protein USDA257_c26880 [Sinorhizobium fredii USDA 257]
MKIRLTDGARFFLLGERKTIFVESSQQIFEVDDITAYLTCLLAEAMSAHDLENALVARGSRRVAARSFVRDYLLEWSRRGVLDVAFDEDEGAPVHTQLLDLAGTAVSIAYHDRGLLDSILPVFDHQAASGMQPLITYSVGRFGERACISRHRSQAMIVTAAEAVPALKTLLTDDVLQNLGAAVALHTALLVKNGNGLLICGAPGAGKTTLALALSEAGFFYGADDIAVLNEDGRLRGVAFAPALKEGSWRLFEGMRDAIHIAPIHRRLDNKRVRYLAPVHLASPEAVPLGCIVLIRRRRSGPAAVRKVEPFRALSELLAGAFTPMRRLHLRQFQTLLIAVSGARVIELTYSRLDKAVETLSRYHDGE